jgi:hypothetical protein
LIPSAAKTWSPQGCTPVTIITSDGATRSRLFP